MTTGGNEHTMAKVRKAVTKKKESSNRLGIIIALIVLGVIGTFAFSLLNNNAAPGAQTMNDQALPREISVDGAFEKREAGAFILDVREQDEWDQVHIPGATLIPLGQLPNRLAEVPKDQEVVVVCRSGNRSIDGRDILLDAGFSQVTSMNGGMNNWSAKGYPTASGR
jgi:rhodanese-related sulfurtransferase